MIEIDTNIQRKVGKLVGKLIFLHKSQVNLDFHKKSALSINSQNIQSSFPFHFTDNIK